MLPKLAFPARPAPYIVTADSPSTLSQNEGLTQKTLVIFQDLDASSIAASGGSYRISTTVAKIVVHDVKDLDITVCKGVVTTLEVHNATNLKLHLEDDTETSSTESTSSEIRKAALYGTVTLDPHLDNVSLDFGTPSIIGSVIVTSSSQAAPERSLKEVRLSVAGQTPFQVDAPGHSTSIGQTHFYFKDGWQKKDLKREEKDYPALGH